MPFQIFGHSPTHPRPEALEALVSLRSYWEALRPPGGLPPRAALDPRSLGAFLGQTFLIQRIGTGLARFRIAGMGLHDLTGMDPRGMPLSCLFDSEGRQRLQPLLEQVFRAPAILTLGLALKTGWTQPPIGARMLLLPVADGEGCATLALGALACAAPSPARPVRFSLLAEAHERLPLRHAGFSGTTEGGTLPPRTVRPDRPYLRLVKG